jgi:membrane protein DedA with SNARE-associated domain
MRGYPLALVFSFLFFGAMTRGQLIYWLGRGVGLGARQLNLNLDRGRAALHKWGLIAIPLAYLTVGLQSLILAAAGAMRIGWFRFSLACIPGALAWAGIYSTIGWAVWRAVFIDGLKSPWTWLVMGAVVTIAVLVARARRRTLMSETKVS